MEFDRDLDHHRRILRMAGDALGMVRRQDHDGLLAELADFLEHSSDGQADLRTLIGVLVQECAAMVGTFTGPSGVPRPAEPVRVEVLDRQSRPVPIDTLEPPVRTMIRIMLAAGYGDPMAAEEQLDLALREAGARELIHLFSLGLTWTVHLAQECARRGLAVVEWARPALD
ncbi:hypothetical protein [Gandjariella thermophila]|uniref:hypothetical protein n=1 Tax=Gandjariella thermophila TaxID=1931992 RepID=UPI0010F7F19F|nr:hypothetical protein [Gandjariella thermophila]